MSGKIEVALRARLCEAILQFNDPLIYLDPSIFKEKRIFWKNTSSLASEIARSNIIMIITMDRFLFGPLLKLCLLAHYPNI